MITSSKVVKSRKKNLANDTILKEDSKILLNYYCKEG